MQSWSPFKQKELLQAVPGSTAAEVTLQLLLQSSHKWVYKAPVRAQPRPTNTALLLEHEAAAGLEGIAEDDVSGAADMLEPPDSIPDEMQDEEYDEEEVQSTCSVVCSVLYAGQVSHSGACLEGTY